MLVPPASDPVLLLLLPRSCVKMSKKVFAMAAPSAGAPLQKIEIELAPLEADQVEIKISHCGVCASDPPKRPTHI